MKYRKYGINWNEFLYGYVCQKQIPNVMALLHLIKMEW